jgi:hypothetical protein
MFSATDTKNKGNNADRNYEVWLKPQAIDTGLRCDMLAWGLGRGLAEPGVS